jgi:gamma-glutamyl hercynylcysteine S-oxide synthase
VSTTLTRPLVAELQAELQDARARTLLLVSTLSDFDLEVQHDSLMSPIIWDLGHIASFEELWLLKQLDSPVEFGEMPGLYNPFEHPRRERGALALPRRADVLEALARVRDEVLQRLETVDFDSGAPLLREGYVYRMVAQHEHQHNETMLQTLQLKTGGPYHPPRRFELPASIDGAGGMIRVPAGEYTIGTDDRSAAYDNERPRHVVVLDAFRLDRTPVTNGQYLSFIADGGYSRPELWSPAGLAWLDQSHAVAPLYWSVTDNGWWTRSMDRSESVDPTRPVCHVSYYEADAFARWAGKRLPTEAEWEVAATWDPARGAARAYPWGDDAPTHALANVDQLGFGTAPVGAYPRNISPLGATGMIGDVWEWTSSDFGPYPGFEAFPYREYSEVFFGNEYKVLRGGSWATRPSVARSTFRNWDYPIRRQIFSGFRCAAND